MIENLDRYYKNTVLAEHPKDEITHLQTQPRAEINKLSARCFTGKTNYQANKNMRIDYISKHQESRKSSHAEKGNHGFHIETHKIKLNKLNASYINSPKKGEKSR